MHQEPLEYLHDLSRNVKLKTAICFDFFDPLLLSFIDLLFEDLEHDNEAVFVEGVRHGFSLSFPNLI